MAVREGEGGPVALCPSSLTVAGPARGAGFERAVLDALVAGPAPGVAAGLEVRREEAAAVEDAGGVVEAGRERAALVSLALVAGPARGDGPLPLREAVGVLRAGAVEALSSESVSSNGWLNESAINL